MTPNRKKQALTVALVLFASFLVARPWLYTYVIWPPLAIRQAWEGTVIEKYEERYGPYGSHTYHWRVECTDGETRTCDVSHALYVGVNKGETVRKEKGKRWPQVVGPPNGYTLLQHEMGDEFPERYRPLVPVQP